MFTNQMLIIGKKLIDGKRVAILDTDNPSIDGIFYNAEEFVIQNGYKFDEFHFEVNGCKFIMNKDTRYVDLRKHYNEYLGE